MIGPWLAAKTPTRSAMGTLFPFLQRMQARDELGLRHAADLEVEAQQIGVNQRRDLADIVLEQCLADVRLDLVAANDARHVGAIFSRQLRVVMQVEEQLAHPVIRHRVFLATDSLRARGADQSHRPARAGPSPRRKTITGGGPLPTRLGTRIRAYFNRFAASWTMLRSACFFTSRAERTKPRSRVMSTCFCSAARSGIMSGS